MPVNAKGGFQVTERQGKGRSGRKPTKIIRNELGKAASPILARTVDN